ncbi:hypothetical protein PAMP_018444 [Pampus punctatissimus]
MAIFSMISRMLCEVLLSSLWFIFVFFWVETISVWLFLSMYYQDQAFYHWGDGVDTHIPREMQT